MQLDDYDRKILRLLQRDARMSSQQLADAVGLSASPCWRRVRRLEEAGVISGHVTLLSQEALGLTMLAFVQVSLEDHHPDTVADFDAMVQSSDQVLECCALSGQYDFLLKVVARDVADFEHFLASRLLARRGVRAANTSFVLKQRKFTTALPV
jgi:DNA-binding Lrp family transcriptional regulator